MTGRTIALSAIVAFAVLAAFWMTLIHAVAPTASTPAAPPSVSGGGITLASDSITLPEEAAALPDGAGLVTARCTACHSTEMIATQPVLNAEKWQATLDKMRTVYKAPIDPADDAKLIAELMALPTQQPAK